MAGTLIQFRLSDAEIEALSAFQQEGESLSLAFKRIGLDVISSNQGELFSNQSVISNQGGSTSNHSSSDSNRADYRDIIKQEVAELESDIYTRLADQLNGLLDTRLGEFVA